MMNSDKEELKTRLEIASFINHLNRVHKDLDAAIEAIKELLTITGYENIEQIVKDIRSSNLILINKSNCEDENLKDEVIKYLNENLNKYNIYVQKEERKNHLEELTKEMSTLLNSDKYELKKLHEKIYKNIEGISKTKDDIVINSTTKNLIYDMFGINYNWLCLTKDDTEI